MWSHNTTILTILISSALCAKIAKPIKFGTCPTAPPGTITTCDVTCSSDSNCKGNQKCCNYGCSIGCHSPIESQPIEKPGSCPASPIDLITTCDVLCTSDSSCSGDKKCCDFGCRRQCVNPVKKSVKPGVCPKAPLGIITTCDVRCFSDDSCKGAQKCCSYGCSVRCLDPMDKPVIDPVPQKPGVCPAANILQDTLTPCVAYCTNDASCEGNQKCCSYGCTLRCANPVLLKQAVTVDKA